jgi:hypothetical protein
MMIRSISRSLSSQIHRAPTYLSVPRLRNERWSSSSSSSSSLPKEWQVSEEVSEWVKRQQGRQIHRVIHDTITEEPLIRLAQTLHIRGEPSVSKPGNN